MNTKYLVEVRTSMTSGYQALANWDTLHATREEAEQSAARARVMWTAARVVPMQVPAHVDHLYAAVAMRGRDTTALYA